MLILKKSNKKITLAKKVVFRKNPFSQGIGLMFHKKISDEAHIFTFNEEIYVPVTMYFVFFSIDILFLDKNKKIVELKENFRPFTNYYPKNLAMYLVELPAGTIKKHKVAINDKLAY